MNEINGSVTEEELLIPVITDEALEAMGGPDILTHYYHCSWVGCETALGCPG